MSLCDRDREILDGWAAAGRVPDDVGNSVRDFACRLVLRLWAAHQRLDAALGGVLALHATDQTYRAVALRYMAGDCLVDERPVDGILRWGVTGPEVTAAEAAALRDLWRELGEDDFIAEWTPGDPEGRVLIHVTEDTE